MVVVLFLLFYVIGTSVPTEGTQHWVGGGGGYKKISHNLDV